MGIDRSARIWCSCHRGESRAEGGGCRVSWFVAKDATQEEKLLRSAGRVSTCSPRSSGGIVERLRGGMKISQLYHHDMQRTLRTIDCIDYLCYEFFPRSLTFDYHGTFIAGSSTSLDIVRIHSCYLVVNEFFDLLKPASSRTAAASAVI